MFTVSCYFLGLSLFFLAAIVCFTTGKRAGKCVEVDLDTLHAASVCLPTGRRAAPDSAIAGMCKDITWDEKIKLKDLKAIWMQWFERCRRKAMQRQKAMYSWTRTMALSAALCLIGVLLEAEFDQPITVRNILAGFRRPTVAAERQSPQVSSQKTPIATSNRSRRE
jgi:hypothetical protein